MIIVMKHGTTQKQIDQVIENIAHMGYESHLIVGVARTVVGAVGIGDKSRLTALESLEGVEQVLPIMQPYKLASRETKPENTVINVDGLHIGGDEIVLMAGPCSVESEEQILHIAREVKSSGAAILRGGAYKPRTSPYSFQGLEEEGLRLLAKARKETGLKIVTEVISPATVEKVAEYSDILQIGARNMQNYMLLKEVGKSRKPILLKRGMAATIKELLMSAEYIMSEGNYNVILCERGIRTFETETRNTLDISAIPVLKKLSHLPVVIDPSHAAGHWYYVEDLSLAAIACGADGLIIEVHHTPETAASDGPQSLKPEKFSSLVEKIRPLAAAKGKKLCFIEN
ncbi:MAG: 3-deoxy-7-phosphoheptulonate synthase [Candidatus Margulisiibacteriota bacterium]|nr:MAG: 3-deoxy-7-phosphoheptulonate synthase [Candidatus Margulisbacteria bacterium GWD2_39_127]OGI05326.1 MAG: 3-deoxy-7-phosphoheptulonate synthase [Candidatus Margulisbacteria bacterium GWF2_38_17]OGI06049.1 MAG: 3-deoxy-7-phosphoheptulonate synthase [Candidatus Margulisbacteria bacterium GWE2_39_32]PZM77311.1 MAG: 3-deoxy-7-phosphoheptulonate synthase [Candidatus Margulisiibacteriota bacterium]HAR62574.1 3-deoxy-7-phosphoheptulonate synthase [Candidatus Margulisiibacteriota bacterium]